MNELVTENPELAANDLVMAKQMAETLHSHYPGHAWAVTCDGATGIATVRNLALSGNWGFTLKLTTTYSASEFRRRIVMAGGELLERYHAICDQVGPMPAPAQAPPEVGLDEVTNG